MNFSSRKHFLSGDTGLNSCSEVCEIKL